MDVTDEALISCDGKDAGSVMVQRLTLHDAVTAVDVAQRIEHAMKT